MMYSDSSGRLRLLKGRVTFGRHAKLLLLGCCCLSLCTINITTCLRKPCLLHELGFHSTSSHKRWIIIYSCFCVWYGWFVDVLFEYLVGVLLGSYETRLQAMINLVKQIYKQNIIIYDYMTLRNNRAMREASFLELDLPQTNNLLIHLYL